MPIVRPALLASFVSACPRAGPTGVPSVFAAVLLDELLTIVCWFYAATGPSATKSRLSRQTRHTMRASRLAIAAIAMFDPRRSATVRAHVRNGALLRKSKLAPSAPTRRFVTDRSRTTLVDQARSFD